MNRDFTPFTVAEETGRCLLCHDAPCTAACVKKENPADFIRSYRFLNQTGARNRLPDCAGCLPVDGSYPCENACIKDWEPVAIHGLITYVKETEAPYSAEEIDLSTEFLGVKCENPFFLSSSIVAATYEMCARALELGWAGVVFKTIGVLKPKEVSPRFDTLGKEGTPFIGFRNLEQISDHDLEENLFFLKKLKLDFPNKVIVASILGQTDEEWTYLARAVSEAGVDIIECNFSCPHMTAEGLGSDVGQNPDMVEHLTACVRKGTHLPILAKMTPNVGNMEPAAIAAIKGGADGIAAINTIKSLTGVDFSKLEVTPSIAGKTAVSGYSGKAVKPIALRFINDIAQHPDLKGIPISGMGGIETWRDAAEFLLLGCGNVQVTTSVMQYGYRIIDDLTDGLKLFMKQAGYRTVDELVGKALPQVISAGDLDRESISYPSFDKQKCVGCGRCYLSCMDAGHQAISFAEERKPLLIGKSCVGCHLCLHVCPTGAISAGKRIKNPSK